MRTESLFERLSFLAHAHKSIVILVTGSIFLLPLPVALSDGGPFPSREGSPRAVHALLLAQSAEDAPDCPLLPGCPSGPSVPLPPGPGNVPAEKKEVFSRGDALSEGTGKYANMVLIPAGSFEMGSAENAAGPDEQPVHKVFVKDFHLAKELVTAQMYCEFLNAEGDQTSDGFPRIRLDSPDCPVIRGVGRFRPKAGWADKPMVCVSWYGASDYAQWVGGRLPTAAEWEKAASLTLRRPHLDNPDTAGSESSTPAKKEPNGVAGPTGKVGAVWEWCSDWYSGDYYRESPNENPTGPPLGQEKEIRGGSYCSPEASHRPQNRHKAAPRGHFRTVGFRIVKD